MTKKHFSKSHIKQVTNVIWLLICLGLSGYALVHFFDNHLVAAYNIVAIALILLFFSGVCLGIKKLKILHIMISFILLLPSLFECAKMTFPKQVDKRREW